MYKHSFSFHFKLFFPLILWTFVFSSCAVTPIPGSQTQVTALASALKKLNPHRVSKKQSTRLSGDIFAKTEALTKAFELTSPPLWHNTLVNVGLRKKGLCHHWSDALYRHLLLQGYKDFEFHLVGANIGEYFYEHNALVVVAKGGSVEEGIILDPWRDSGKLFFSKLKADTRYKWSHRQKRGCN